MTESEAGPPPDEPGVVLVVDDTVAGRYVTASWLRRRGHEVIEVGTGAEALETMAARAVDLVVLDVGLPDMSGFDVCAMIKGDPVLTRPVVHLSATSVRGADRVQGLTRGADAYLVEPVEPEELIATVDSVLRSYRARDAAETLAERLAALTRASLAMNAGATVEQVVEAVAVGAAEMVGAEAVALVHDADGALRWAATSPGGGRLDGADGPTSAMRELLVAEALAPPGAFRVPWRVVGPATANDMCCAFVFRSRGSLPVALAVRRPTLQPAHTELLAQLGQAAALSLDALRLHTQEHDLALTLQRSFMPPVPPDRPGVEIAARYEPAGDNTEIGGDFYEIVELRDGRLLAAIGDVAGHSVHAATVMVELRHALRAYALDGHGPREILERLERMLRVYHPDEFATLCLLLLDEEHNRLTVANAGHLPPLLIGPAGSEYLVVGGPMVGLRRPHPPATELELPPTWSLVLITDGLVEAPGADLDAELEHVRVTAPPDATAEERCDVLLSRFAQNRLADVAVLVLRRIDRAG
jgi:CheY-like chemotaxis protein